MSELRAPDPTLVALDENVIVDDYYDADAGVATAHLDPVPERCSFSFRIGLGDWSLVPTSAAAYFAVPCRECFPDAPISGVRRNADGVESGDPHLAWQVSS